MTKLGHRLARLEGQIGCKADRMVVRIMRTGQTFALPREDCEEILAKSGFFKQGIRVLDFLNVPDGLTAKELREYLLEHAEESVEGDGGRMTRGLAKRL